MQSETTTKPLRKKDTRKLGKLRVQLSGLFPRIRDDRNEPRTVVIVPSLTLDEEVLSRISGVHHYEERLLCLLLLLRYPRTHVIYVTSTPINEEIIDYYLHLLPGIPALHARRRLTLISCDDASPKSLTAKLLERPRVLGRIREAIPDRHCAHLSCFTVTELEARLSLKLELPLYGCDPSLTTLGDKSGSRKLFRAAGLDLPDGAEDLETPDDVIEELAALKERQPELRRAVVKINEGFSGEGNAVFHYDGAPEDADKLRRWIRDRLPNLAYEAGEMSWAVFSGKLEAMGGIVEAFIEGENKRSPSVQCRIDPIGSVDAMSTHDQILGGASGQIFLGARFPADDEYRLEIQEAGMKVAQLLGDKGVLGRFSIDFLSVRDESQPGNWKHYAIEINLRKGGTTHPFMMLQSLTDGAYDAATGHYLTRNGRPRYYHASDNLESELYKGLLPYDLVDIAAMHQLNFHSTQQQGVVFHLMGALSEFGKLGVVCIGDSPERASEYYEETVAILDKEGRAWQGL
ncbi:MAG: carboxylate-amine ligase [Gammaproteobacteria bacterium]|nr:MAG: carboxylate-amine ligase [Gammaproteobacteria bacterium]